MTIPPLRCDEWPDRQPCCEPWQVDMSCCCDWLQPGDEGWTPQRQALQDAALTWAESFIDTRTMGLYRRCKHRRTICLPQCPPATCDGCDPTEQVELPFRLVNQVVAIWAVDGTDLTSTFSWALRPPNILAAVGQPFPRRTLVVDVLVGHQPTPELLAAVAELACQRLRQCLGLDCDLVFDDTSRVGRVRRSRTGRRDIVATGVPIVDMFLMDFALKGVSGFGDPVTGVRVH